MLDFVGGLGFVVVTVIVFVALHRDDYEDILALIGAILTGFLVAVPYFVAAAVLNLLRNTTNTLNRVEWWLSYTARLLHDQAPD